MVTLLLPCMFCNRICHLKTCLTIDCWYSIQGFGMMLMAEAERIARDEHGANKIAVISGNWVFGILHSLRVECIPF